MPVARWAGLRVFNQEGVETLAACRLPEKADRF